MASFLCTVVLLSVCLSVTVSGVSGLRCYKCVGGTASNFIGQAILNAITDFDGNCVDTFTRAPELAVTCPDVNGTMAKCLKITAKVNAFIYTADIVERMCSQENIIGDHCGVATAAERKVIKDWFPGSSETAKQCLCGGELCNGQIQLSAAKLIWLAGFLLTMALSHQ